MGVKVHLVLKIKQKLILLLSVELTNLNLQPLEFICAMGVIALPQEVQVGQPGGSAELYEESEHLPYPHPHPPGNGVIFCIRFSCDNFPNSKIFSELLHVCRP